VAVGLVIAEGLYDHREEKDMATWEYLFLSIEGHNDTLRKAQNMLVSTSDGRWNDEKMPNDPAGLVNRLGIEGWEMVNSCGNISSLMGVGVTPSATPLAHVKGGAAVYHFDAVFKRPVP